MKFGAVPMIYPGRHAFREESLCPNIYVRR